MSEDLNNGLPLPTFKLGSLPMLSPLKVYGVTEKAKISTKTQKPYNIYIHTLSSVRDNLVKKFNVELMRNEYDTMRVLQYFNDNPLINVTEKVDKDKNPVLKNGYRQYIISGVKA